MRLPRDGRGCVAFLRRAAKSMIAGRAPGTPVAAASWPWLLAAGGRGGSSGIGSVARHRTANRKMAGLPGPAAGDSLVLAPAWPAHSRWFSQHVLICLSRPLARHRWLSASMSTQSSTATIWIPSWLASWPGGPIGCKLVYDCHEFLPYAWPYATRWNRWLLGRYEGRLIRFADSVFTVSSLLAAEMMGPIAASKYSRSPTTPSHWHDEQGSREGGAGSRYEAALSLLPAPRSPLRPPTSGVPPPGEFGPDRGIEELIRAWQAIDPKDAGAAVAWQRPRAAQEKLRTPGRIAGTKRRGCVLSPPVREDHRISSAAEADIGVIPYKPTTVHFRYCCPEQTFGVHAGGLAADGRQYGLCPPDRGRIWGRIVLRTDRSGLHREHRAAAGGRRRAAAAWPAQCLGFVRETFHGKRKASPSTRPIVVSPDWWRFKTTWLFRTAARSNDRLVCAVDLKSVSTE